MVHAGQGAQLAKQLLHSRRVRRIGFVQYESAAWRRQCRAVSSSATCSAQAQHSGARRRPHQRAPPSKSAAKEHAAGRSSGNGAPHLQQRRVHSLLPARDGGPLGKHHVLGSLCVSKREKKGRAGEKESWQASSDNGGGSGGQLSMVGRSARATSSGPFRGQQTALNGLNGGALKAWLPHQPRHRLLCARATPASSPRLPHPPHPPGSVDSRRQ